MVPSLAPLFAPFRRLRGATILLALMVAGASDASALADRRRAFENGPTLTTSRTFYGAIRDT